MIETLLIWQALPSFSEQAMNVWNKHVTSTCGPAAGS